MCVGHDSALPALCGHQGGGVSAPYAGRNPSWRAPNAIVHFDYLYMGESAVDAGTDSEFPGEVPRRSKRLSYSV